MRGLKFILTTFILAGVLLPISIGHAQTLGEVLRALQHRNQLVQESWGATSINNIKWEGVSSATPSDGEVNGLSIQDQLKLLKQAIHETDRLSGSFLESRVFSSGEGQALWKLSFQRMDDRVSVEKFSSVLRKLAARISQLKSLYWDGDWTRSGYEYTIYKVSSLPKFSISLTSNSSNSVVSNGSGCVADIAAPSGSGALESDDAGETYQIYNYEHGWSSPTKFSTKGSSLCPGKIRVVTGFHYMISDISGLPDKYYNAQNYTLISSDFSAGQSGDIELPEIIGSNLSILGTWNEYDVDGDGFIDKVFMVPKVSGQDSSDLWEPQFDPMKRSVYYYFKFNIDEGSAFLYDGSDLNSNFLRFSIVSLGNGNELWENFRFASIFTADFGAEFSKPRSPVPEQTLPLIIVPDFAKKSIRLLLSNRPDTDATLVWRFPDYVKTTFDRWDDNGDWIPSGAYIIGSLAARNDLVPQGDGNWDAVYSGKIADREDQIQWSGGPNDTNERWPDFASYVSQWWNPVLTQIVTANYGIKITQDGLKYKIDVYRRDQVSGPTDGAYAFSGSPVETYQVENPTGESDGGSLKITGSGGVVYNVTMTPSWTDKFNLDYTTWEFTETQNGTVLVDKKATVREPTWDDDGNFTRAYTVVEESSIDKVALPKVTTTYWDKWANPSRIDKVVEANGVNDTRTTTYTYHKENDDAGHLQIKYLENIAQTGGTNPYSADYNDMELLTHYADTYGSVDVSYSGSKVMRIEKINGQPVRTLVTTYSGDMSTATTTAQ
jgi:hypothetical protein